MKVDMVNTLILSCYNQCLLTHNCKNGASRYEFCGGKVNPNETLEQATIRENLEELGIGIKITKVFGDYPTHSPEGDFLCRTFHAEIISGNPEPKEPKKMDWCGYVSYERLCNLRDSGLLVPNLVLALPKLKEIVS